MHGWISEAETIGKNIYKNQYVEILPNTMHSQTSLFSLRITIYAEFVMVWKHSVMIYCQTSGICRWWYGIHLMRTLLVTIGEKYM